jgi:outer membrane protein assembly factor BamA
MKRIFLAILAAASLLAASSCSTTRALQDGEYRLRRNKIEVTNDDEFNTNVLTPYIKQRSIGWTPFMTVYNWTNGKGKAWDKLVQKVGVAPVVYDASMVDESIEGIEKHLEYLGYYGSKAESQINVNKRRVDVTYKVTLGKRFPISDINLTLPSRGEFREAFLADTSAMTIRKGDFLSEAALETETERSAAQLRNQGFFTFNKNHFFFEADTLTNPGSAILNMSIREYTRNASPKDAQPIRKFYTMTLQSHIPNR